MDFETYCHSTCLRWCCPIAASLETPWPKDNVVDFFIERHLAYLPLPRFQETPYGPTIQEICACALRLQTLCGVDITESVDTIDTIQDSEASKMHECFAQLVPNLDTLRDLDLPNENMHCALALLALDPHEFGKISTTMLHSEIFPDLALQAVQQDIGPTSLETILETTDAFLCKRFMHHAFASLPDAQSDWIQYAVARDQMMIQVPSLEHYTLVSGLSLKALESHAYVKNLVDEDPEIGFRWP